MTLTGWTISSAGALAAVGMVVGVLLGWCLRGLLCERAIRHAWAEANARVDTDRARQSEERHDLFTLALTAHDPAKYADIKSTDSAIAAGTWAPPADGELPPWELDARYAGAVVIDEDTGHALVFDEQTDEYTPIPLDIWHAKWGYEPPEDARKPQPEFPDIDKIDPFDLAREAVAARKGQA